MARKKSHTTKSTNKVYLLDHSFRATAAKYLACHDRKRASQTASDLSTYSSSATRRLPHLALTTPFTIVTPAAHPSLEEARLRNIPLPLSSSAAPIRLGTKPVFASRKVPSAPPWLVPVVACTLFFSPAIQCSATPALRERAIFPSSRTLVPSTSSSTPTLAPFPFPVPSSSAFPNAAKGGLPFAPCPNSCLGSRNHTEVPISLAFCCLFAAMGKLSRHRRMQRGTTAGKQTAQERGTLFGSLRQQRSNPETRTRARQERFEVKSDYHRKHRRLFLGEKETSCFVLALLCGLSVIDDEANVHRQKGVSYLNASHYHLFSLHPLALPNTHRRCEKSRKIPFHLCQKKICLYYTCYIFRFGLPSHVGTL